MQFKHGAYYYVQNLGKGKRKWHFLSRNKREALMRYYSEFVGRSDDIATMGALFDRYITDVASKKAEKTYENNLREIANLRKVFGAVNPNDVTPVMIYRYLDKRGKKAVRGANMEKSTLSGVLNFGIRCGALAQNPCRDVKSLKEAKIKRDISDEEFAAVRAMAPRMIACAMQLAYLTGLRQGDVLRLKLADITAEGLLVITKKTGAILLFEWTAELRACIEQIKALKRPIRGLNLFCSRSGTPYKPSGFKSIWQRIMINASTTTEKRDAVISRRFKFHDIRRKSAKDADKLYGREFARKLLGHKTQSMTAGYIGGAQQVKPLL